MTKMTKEEALTVWLPVIKMGVKDMPECNEALDMATEALEQESKTGHWVDSSNGWMCSECKRDSTKDTKYCPNCGVKMDEVKEK